MYDHQIIVVINEGIDGTLEWVESQHFDFIHHKDNVGICIGLNSATSKVQNKYFVYLNDDMYVLPKWDSYLEDVIATIPDSKFMLSSTMIEPVDTGNPCVIVKSFGSQLSDFKENELLQFHNENHNFKDWNGASWPPFIVPIELWKEVEGFSDEFSPGMYSDPDFSMKLWQNGVRYFRGVGASKVYHFGKKSTQKLSKNTGRNIFLNKWGITARYFYKNYLKMGEPWIDKLPEFKPSVMDKFIHFLKKMK